MPAVTTFSYDAKGLGEIKSYKFGRNWPVVYVAENGKEVYIGETQNAYLRSKQHLEREDRRRLKRVHVITDEEYNKSATLDIESQLIQFMAADSKFILQNGNGGLQNNNYYDREKYKAKFELVWESLKQSSLVIHTLNHLKNTDLFKYSPYKTLTEDQLEIAIQIYNDLKNNRSTTYVINGKPGTGKTILAVYLFKFLKEQEETKNLKIGLVVPMTSLRKTIGKVFRNIKGLKSNMVIGPNDVVKDKYDLLIVDEAHRLKRRVNITNYKAFDDINKMLVLGKTGTELDWIIKSSNNQILFYDKNQSIRPADIRPEDYNKINPKYYELSSQMRVEGGEDYIKFVEDVFDLIKPEKTEFKNYDFKVYDDIHQMVNDIKNKDKEHQLARVVAGYAWPWHTKKGKEEYDIEINGIKLIWNSVTKDWINSPNAVNEVGCIHTVQGYDLNYVGVIIGPEFSYDKDKKKFKVDKEKYFDINGRNGVTDPEELERYIINIYKTLLTRGIKGTYVYIIDDNLREYFNSLWQGLE